MAAPNIKIALGMLLSADEMRRLNVDAQVVNEIRFVMWEFLFPILQRSSLVGNSPDISWTYTRNDLTDRDLVVYFVANMQRSVIKKKFGQAALDNAIKAAKGKPLGGLTTWNTPWDATGVISEVYVENNFPARKLGVNAFHELMHNKAQIDNSMHDIKGIGVGMTGGSECTRLTEADILLMTKKLTARVPQYADELPGDIAVKFFIKKTDPGYRMTCS
jgi:hypothetical protein